MKADAAAILGFLLCCSVPAQGALYQFTIQGEVTYALFGDVKIGSPATIRYIADSQDSNPDPSGGVYSATGATIEFPNLTVTTPPSGGVIYVSLNSNAPELVHYQHPGPFHGLTVAFRFPDGTIQSDALPLTLPLAYANIHEFIVRGSLIDVFRGNITSYHSFEVPEPSQGAVLLLSMMCLGRRGRHSRGPSGCPDSSLYNSKGGGHHGRRLAMESRQYSPARRNRRTSRTCAVGMDYAIEALERRLILSASLSLSGTQTVTLGPVVNASNDLSSWESEMSVVVNPKDPLNIVGFTFHILSNYTAPQIDVLWSKQGGKAGSWTTNVIDHADDDLGTTSSRGDPVLTFDDNGNLFIGYLAVVPGSPNTAKIVMARSTDGGESFGQFTVIDSAPQPPTIPIDKPFIASGRDPVSGDPAVYIAYTSHAGGAKIAVRGTRDGGLTYKPPLNEPPLTVGTSGNGETFACPAVGPNGELYVSWYDRDTSGSGTHKIYMDRDLDGLWGSNFTFDASGDATVRTLSNGSLANYPVNAAPTRGIHTAPILTVDRSGGTYNGRLYLSFIELNAPAPSHDTNVILGYGTLNLQTQTVSWTFLDTPQTRVDSSTGTEFHPWVDVDQATGSANLLYYTTDGDQGDGNNDVIMRLGFSLNGGANWSTAMPPPSPLEKTNPTIFSMIIWSTSDLMSTKARRMACSASNPAA